jgi:predicted metal-binding membrane protein
VPTGIFAAGYLAAWGGYSALAVGLQSSSMNTAASFSWLICRNDAKNRLPTGLVMLAMKARVGRNKAASNVEPARGRPEMK